MSESITVWKYLKLDLRCNRTSKGEVSYILVLAALPVLEPGSLALRRPLPLDTLPEEMARLWRVGEGFVCVDLAGESLIE